MTPYHYTKNNPITRFDLDGKQDYSSLIRTKNSLMNSGNVISRNIFNFVDQNAIGFYETTSTVLLYSAQIPTPATPFLLGAATVYQLIATTLKLNKQGFSQDVIGDIAGEATIELTQKKIPIVGSIVNVAVDNYKLSEGKVDRSVNCHSTIQGNGTPSLLKSVDREKWGSSKSAEERWKEMYGNEEVSEEKDKDKNIESE